MIISTILESVKFAYTNIITGNSKSRGYQEMIDYSPLWNTISQKNITQYLLLKDGILDNKTLDGLKHNKNITLLTLERICKYLQCTPNDVVRFTDE